MNMDNDEWKVRNGFQVLVYVTSWVMAAFTHHEKKLSNTSLRRINVKVSVGRSCGNSQGRWGALFTYLLSRLGIWKLLLWEYPTWRTCNLPAQNYVLTDMVGSCGKWQRTSSLEPGCLWVGTSALPLTSFLIQMGELVFREHSVQISRAGFEN